jgi:hypothetical protein
LLPAAAQAIIGNNGNGRVGENRVNAKCISILVFVLALLTGSTSHAQSLKWTLQNNSGEFALLRFYSKSRNVAWPSFDRAYNLPADGVAHAFPISCFAGEYICYGAWIGRTPATRWGVGQVSTNACSKCCNLCNGSNLRVPNLVK